MKRKRSTGSELLAAKYQGVADAMRAETDRGLALVMAAYLDDLLDDLLRKSFIDDRAVAKELLDFNRPLSSFSAKIELTYALGLISNDLHRKLHQIREIRNHFAHASGAKDFNDAGIADRCGELASLPDLIAKASPPELHPRMKFVDASSIAFMELQLWIHQAEHPPIRMLDPETKL